MKHMNEIRWAGRVYRHAAGAEGGDDGGGDGGSNEGAGGQGGGDDGGDAAAASGGDGAGGDGGDAGGDAGGAGDDWRTRLSGYAGEGEDYSGLLGRFNDEATFVKSAVQAHEKLRAGELSTGLPDEPTDEQLANWREAHGVPVDGTYDFSGADRELSEMDVEMLGPVAEIAHKHNISQDALTELMTTYMGETDKIVEQMQAQDGIDAQEYHKTVKEAWGADYTINLNRITNAMNLLPESVRDSFKAAKMADGRGIMNSPEVMNWIVGMDRQITPLDPMKGGTESTLSDARTIVEKAKERMRDDSVGWHKDKDAQKEFMQAQDFIDKFEGSQ